MVADYRAIPFPASLHRIAADEGHSTGPSAGDLPLTSEVRLTGEPVHPGHHRRLTTHVQHHFGE